MKTIHKVMASLLIISLVACSGNSAKKEAEKPTFNIVEGKNLKGEQKVAIASFRVVFINSGMLSVRAEDKSVFRAKDGSARSTIKATLGGVDETMMQEITNKAYDDFQASLVANGYTVLAQDKVMNDKQYKKIKVRESGVDKSLTKGLSNLLGKATGDKDTVSYPTYSPEGLNYLNSSFFCKEMEPLFANTCLSKVADSLDVSVIHVQYTVDFASFSGDSSANINWSATGGMDFKAETSIGQQLSLVPVKSGVTVIKPNGKITSVYLQVGRKYSSAQAYGESRESTSTVDKLASGFNNLLGSASGDAYSYVEYEIVANPDAYRGIVGGLMSNFAQESAKDMAAYR
jgi:hypothetical protein